MRRTKKKIVSFKNDFTPWQQKIITDTDRHFQDNFTSLSLYHSTHSAQEFSAKPRNSTIIISLSELQPNSSAITNPKIHSKTLSVIRDYCSKKIDQESTGQRYFQKKSKSADLITKSSPQKEVKCQSHKLKKASIVDLSKSLDQQLKPAKFGKIPKTLYGSRILKIKNEIRNEKFNGRKKILRYQKQQHVNLHLESHSLPIRRVFSPYSPQKIKTRFPKHNFGEMLSEYLSKV